MNQVWIIRKDGATCFDKRTGKIVVGIKYV